MRPSVKHPAAAAAAGAESSSWWSLARLAREMGLTVAAAGTGGTAVELGGEVGRRAGGMTGPAEMSGGSNQQDSPSHGRLGGLEASRRSPLVG